MLVHIKTIEWCPIAIAWAGNHYCRPSFVKIFHKRRRMVTFVDNKFKGN